MLEMISRAQSCERLSPVSTPCVVFLGSEVGGKLAGEELPCNPSVGRLRQEVVVFEASRDKSETLSAVGEGNNSF